MPKIEHTGENVRAIVTCLSSGERVRNPWIRFPDEVLWTGPAFADTGIPAPANVNAAFVTSCVGQSTSSRRVGIKRVSLATAVGQAVSTRRVGRRRSSVTTGQGVTQIVHRRGVSRSTASTGQATTTSSRRRGVKRGAASTCTAAAAFLHRKGVRRSALSSGVGSSPVAHRRGVSRALTSQGTGQTPFAFSFAATFNFNAAFAANGTGTTTSSRRKGAKRPLAVQGTGAAPWSRRRGAARGSSSTCTGAVAWTHRRGVSRALGTTGRATAFYRTPTPHTFTSTGIGTTTFTSVRRVQFAWLSDVLWACPVDGGGMRQVSPVLTRVVHPLDSPHPKVRVQCQTCDFFMDVPAEALEVV